MPFLPRVSSVADIYEWGCTVAVGAIKWGCKSGCCRNYIIDVSNISSQAKGGSKSKYGTKAKEKRPLDVIANSFIMSVCNK
jgi:hypothetical protein